MEPQVLINKIKERFELTTDTQVANLLGATRQQIADWRNGHRPMPLTAQLKAADHLGYAWARKAILFLAPELISKDNLRTKKRVNNETE